MYALRKQTYVLTELRCPPETQTNIPYFKISIQCISRFNFTAYVYTAPVVLFSFLYNLPRFFEWKTVVETYEIPCYIHYNYNSINYEDQDDNNNNNLTYEYVDYPMIEPNCTEVVHNVSLIPMELRKNEIYIAVRKSPLIFMSRYRVRA